MFGEWKKLCRECDRGREKLDLEFTRKSETKPIAGEGKNKERRDAERERKEETRQGEGERKEEETRPNFDSCDDSCPNQLRARTCRFACVKA